MSAGRKVRVAFRGFGRVGMHVFRALYSEPWFECSGIVVPEPNLSARARALARDEHTGTWGHSVKPAPDGLCIDGATLVPVHTSAHALRCAAGQSDILVECTTGDEFKKNSGGAFLLGSECGAGKILFTYPVSGARFFVYGVNHADYHPACAYVSAASCTTNCLAVIIAPILKRWRIDRVDALTVHAVTSSQKAIDAFSIRPYTTGAAGAIEKIFPELAGRIAVSCVRVPVPQVSYLQTTFALGDAVDRGSIIGAYRSAASGALAGVLRIVAEEKKIDNSSLYRADPHSAIINESLTDVLNGRIVKISAWYDNEYAYSIRVCDLLSHIARCHGWPDERSDDHVDDYIPRPSYPQELSS